ncbi:MAG: DUF885 family protein, partial [Oscillospiraceae bacterium]|nr:DUF885 family protein [Oscillospiraceae bacterium]
MKHKHNRLGLLSLTLVLCFSLSACQWVMSFLPSGSTSAASPAETQQQFDDFLQQQFVKNITADTLSMHQLLKCPANFGITDYAATWGDYTCAYPTDEQIAQDRQDMQILQSFDRSQLTPAQQASYDILQYEAQLYDQSLQFFYYDDPFGNNNEFHAMIPVMLSEYDFFSKQDVENYLTLCGSMDQLWNGCLQFEQQKSAKGLFMTDTQVTTIVNDCQTFLSKTDDNVLITSFKTRIDAIPFLTDAEKTDYITRNQDIFNNTVVPAYHTLMDGLTALKGTGQNSGGLALFD